MKYNRNPLYRAVHGTMLAAMSASLMGTAGMAFAQEEDDDAAQLDRVQVTGSRISRVDIEGANPVTVLDREDIERTGLSDLGDLLRELPSITGGPLGQQSNNPGFTSGSSTTDIRGLGSNRTLFLVNGRRSVDGGDIASIPFSIVERIEILKDGASAVYGADAVAGVVNIITRRDYEGAEIQVQYSQFTELDDFDNGAGEVFDTDNGENLRASFTFGGNYDRGNFVVSVEYNDQKSIFQGEVSGSDALQAPLFLTTSGIISLGSSFIPQGRFTVDVDGDGVREIVILDEGQDGQDVSDFRPFIGGGAVNDTYNYAPVNFVQRPFERRSVYVQADYDLFDNVTAYFESRFLNREADRLLAPLPFGTIIGNPGAPLPTIPGALGITADNVFNPFGQDISDPRRRVVETGGRRFLGEVNQLNLVTGARGTFANTWEWDVSWNYGRRTSDANLFGQFFGPNLAPALGPSFFDDAGNAVCGTPEAPIAGCVPLNLFGGPGSITQEQLDFVSVSTSSRTTSVQQIFNATLVGDIVDLPAGPLGTAFGYEFRKEQLDVLNDSGIQTGQVTGNSAGNTNGEYDVDSIFAEFNIPLLADLPGAQLLELAIGARYDDYSTIGSNETFQAQFRWQPIQGLLVRGTYGEVFREPSIGELFAAVGEGFPTASDPCSVDFGIFSQLTPEQQQNCFSTGVPQTGAIQGNAQVRALVGGNPTLDPEEGDTFTVGVAWSPEFLPGFSLTLDYWEVELDDAIASFSAQTILTECALNGNLCEQVTRVNDGFGTINATLANNQNLGSFTREGVDFNFSYSKDTSIGLFDADLIGTYLLTAETEIFEGAGITTQEGRVDNVAPQNTNADFFPELRLRFNLDWTLGNWGASYSATFIDSLEYTPTFLANDVTIASQTYHDLFGNYNFNTGTRLTVGLTNILDNQPPIVDIGNANTGPETYRLSGRQFLVRVTHNF